LRDRKIGAGLLAAWCGVCFGGVGVGLGVWWVGCGDLGGVVIWLGWRRSGGGARWGGSQRAPIVAPSEQRKLVTKIAAYVNFECFNISGSEVIKPSMRKGWRCHCLITCIISMPKPN